MKPTEIFALRVPGRPALSPDGHRVAVSVRYPDVATDEYAAHLWLAPTDRSAPAPMDRATPAPMDRAAPARQLSQGWHDTEPVWSPDGRWLAFVRAERDAGTGTVGKPQLWVLPVDGGEARRLTDHPHGMAAPVWSPDSTRLAYEARVPEPGRYGTDKKVGAEAEPPRRITTLRYRADDLGYTIDRRSQIWVVDLDGGEPSQVTSGDADHVSVDWSPAGELLAFAAARHRSAGDDLRRDIWVCAPDGSQLRALTTGGLEASQPRFTPDGATVCFVAGQLGAGDRANTCRNVGLWVVPADGSGEAIRLTNREQYHLARPGGMIEPTPTGVLFTDEHRGAVRLLRVPYDGGEPELVLGGELQVLGASSRGAVTVVTYADASHAGELAVVDQAKPRPLSAFNQRFGAEIAVTPMVPLSASAPDGHPVPGWVLRPAGDGPHPVLLMIHGGPFYQYGWNLFDEAQVCAAAGYAVVMGNPRGSSGYGESHGRAVVGNVGEVSATDLLALLDAALAADPSLDAGRVGVMGGSHGGYMATWLAAHHGHRFRAAISERSLNAIDSFTGTSDIGWYFTDDLYGPDPAQKRVQSPLTYADQITIPMLLIHSEHDWRCPLEQAQRLFVALKRHGTPVEFLLFPGEGHELSRSGRPSHRVARFDAILEWWSRHL